MHRLLKTKDIKALTVLYICVALDIVLFLSCYIMIANHEKIVNSFIFEHKNKPLEFHPFDAKLLLRIDELDKKIDIVNDKCSK